MPRGASAFIQALGTEFQSGGLDIVGPKLRQVEDPDFAQTMLLKSLAQPLRRLPRRSLGTIPATQFVWHNGSLVRWEDAQVHILSTAVQFGLSMFEGMRCYATPRGPSILLLDEHLRRLRESCKMYRIAVPFSDAELAAACKATVRANELGSCYVRPMVLVGYGAMGLDGAGSPIECYVPAWEWGGYLGDDSVFEAGIDCCTASWARAAPNTFPGMAKCAGNYVNAHLIKREAQVNGYAEAVALSPDGMVSEGSGQNIFVVRDGELVTPPINGSNLQGLTRRAVLALAAEAGVPARVEPVTREQLVVADELFFAGTATEVMPIRSLDRITIGADGRRGPITERIQSAFHDIVHGRVPDRFGWLSPVDS